MDDADTHSKILFFLEQFWTFFAVALGVALSGIAAKRIVGVLVPAERQVAAAEAQPAREPARDGGPYRGSSRPTPAEIATDPKLPLWYRLWRASISMHPVLVGGLVGLAPVPVANWVPDGTTAHMLWFALAGALSGQIFEIGKRLAEIIPAVIRQRLGVRAERPTPPVPEPATASEPAAKDDDPAALPKD